jgi:hypothetical protein
MPGMARFLRLRFAVAQIGARRGGRQSLALLPTEAELPGTGWRMLDERCWRTGATAHEPWERRARALGCVSAWRSFEQRPAGRWLWTQIVPLASDEDGVEALKVLPSRLMANWRAHVTVTSRREVDGLDVPGTQAVWAEEHTTAGEAGTGVARMLAWVADSAVAALSFASVDPIAWSWDEVTALATAQAARRRSTP